MKIANNIFNPSSQLYPSVIASSPTINIPSLNTAASSQNLGNLDISSGQDISKLSLSTLTGDLGQTQNNLNPELSTLQKPTNENQANLQDIVNTSFERLKNSGDTTCKQANDAAFMVNQRLSDILDKVSDELEAIRSCKPDNKTLNGFPCDITGSWNSEVMGLKFEITPTSNEKELIIDIKERYPSKSHSLIQPDWKSSGSVIHKLGGPFNIVSKKCEENSLATFVGLCKVCTGVDTIIGTWTFVRPANSCEDTQLSIETHRDILRRSILNEKKKQRLEELRKKLLAEKEKKSP